MPRFDAERIAVTRPVLALTGIVAAVAISVGIKDYVQQKQAKPPASRDTQAVVYSKAKTPLKKSTSAKARQAPLSATEANALATMQDADENMEQALISKEFTRDSRIAMDVIDNLSNAVATPGSAHQEVEAAQCVPLPNGTKPGDVDEVYYKNWARAYGCIFPP